MKSFFWAFSPHPNMGETFSSNSESSKQLPWNTKTSVIEMTNNKRSARQGQQEFKRTMKLTGEVCQGRDGVVLPKKLHIDRGFTELAN